MFSTIPYRTFILLESVIFLLAFHEEKKKEKRFTDLSADMEIIYVFI